MSACQKCWRDACIMSREDVAATYVQLIDQRKDSPCSPEDQAGRDATECPVCKRRTVHEITGECMVATCAHWEANS